MTVNIYENVEDAMWINDSTDVDQMIGGHKSAADDYRPCKI